MGSIGLEESKVQMTDQNPFKFILVLGGPGGGKSTQCRRIGEVIGYRHVSHGDVIRAETKSGSECGKMIEEILKQGKRVSANITVQLMLKAMRKSGATKFLVDGFPRDEEARLAFEAATNAHPEIVLFFDCPEQERERRLLTRNQGRKDDKIEIIRERFKRFEELSVPVIKHYEFKGKVVKIDADKDAEEVFECVKAYLIPKLLIND